MSSKFKSGDKVRVVERTEDFNGDWNNDWVHEMEQLVGNGVVYTVKAVDSAHGVQLESGPYWDHDWEYMFDPESLEKVEE